MRTQADTDSKIKDSIRCDLMIRSLRCVQLLKLSLFGLIYALWILLGMVPTAIASESTSSLSLEEIGDVIQLKGARAGKFSQCSYQGDYKMLASGVYQSDPESGLTWTTLLPTPDSLIISPINNANQNPLDELETRKRVNPFQKLVGALVSFEPDEIRKNFTVTIFGSIESYTIELLPKKRIAKIMNRIDIVGQSGWVTQIDLNMKFEKRVNIMMSQNEEEPGDACED